MNKGFAKFRKQSRVGAWIRSTVFGLAAGCIAGTVPILIAKITGQDPNIGRSLLIGGIAAALAFAVLFLILLPTNRRIAKRLDRVLSLDEKVQTMLEFKDAEGDMIAVQRETTNKILLDTPLKKARYRHAWLSFIAPILALTLVTVSIVIPAKAEDAPVPPPETTYNLSAWQEQALKDLIEAVRLSDMESAPKDSTVLTLETLLARLKTVKKESEMKQHVIKAIDDIYISVNDHNTYDLIAARLASSSISESAILGQCIRELGYTKVTDTLDLIRTTSNADNSEQIKNDIETELKASGVVSTDPLRKAISEFFGSLEKTYAESDGLSQDELGKRLDAVYLTGKEQISSALLAQYTNETVSTDTRSRLMAIFGITSAELPDHLVPKDNSSIGGESGEVKDDDDLTISPGGLGSGEMVFGSDDMIYDPIRGEYVTYGEVIRDYYASISEQLVDGNISYDLEELISDYFASLFDGSKNNDNG